MFKDIISIYKINAHSVPAQAHVSKAERNIQVTKERVRSSVHYLPYNKILKIILIYIVQDAANKLNYFPVQNGISQHYSPRMIVTKKALNYATHGIHYTGEFVMAHNNESIKNNLNPRALECIYLRSSDTLYHKHQLYHISTRKFITRRTCTSAKNPDHMLCLLEEQATTQNMPSGIDFNHEIDDNLFAGVGDNTNINMNEEKQDEIHMDTTQIQDELYEPSPFLTPSTKNNSEENT